MNVKWEWVGLDLSLRMHTIEQQPILKLNKTLITLSMNTLEEVALTYSQIPI